MSQNNLHTSSIITSKKQEIDKLVKNLDKKDKKSRYTSVEGLPEWLGSCNKSLMKNKQSLAFPGKICVQRLNLNEDLPVVSFFRCKKRFYVLLFV